MSDLLPANATQPERALSLAIDRPVPVPVRSVWNPDTCPENLLPWLAWAFSLDTWDSNWTEDQKRGAIKASVAVHERKGTIGALRTALEAVGLEFETIEWFQKTPAGTPYTFDVAVDVTDIGITESTYNQVAQIIEATKNLRSHLETLKVRAVVRGTLFVGSATLSGSTTEIYPYTAGELESTALMNFSARTISGDTVNVYPGN